MKSCPTSHLILAALIAAIGVGCKASEEKAQLPHYPFPDGGLVDAYRKLPVDAPVPNEMDSAQDGSGDAVEGCPNACDDYNPCTVDVCDVKTGSCSNTPMAADSPCANACLAGGKGSCKSGFCSGSPAPDGTACNAHNLCTLNDACKGGVCLAGQQKTCPPADTCHETGKCDITTGQCIEKLADDGKWCDDGLACTVEDRCTQGVCGGSTLWCSTGATCNPSTGAVCKLGDQVAFPSATWALALENVTFGSPGNLALGPEQEAYLVGTFAVKVERDAGAGLDAPARDAGGDALEKPREDYNNDLWVARLDPATGQMVWRQTFGDSQDQQGSAIAANARGQVAVSGKITGTMTMGTSTLVTPGGKGASESFVAAVDAATGAGLWTVRPMVTDGSLALAADPVSGDFVVCGTASDFPATGLDEKATSADTGDIVMARLDARTGLVVWGRQFSGPSRETCDAVAFDASGNLFLAGTMKGMIGGGRIDLGSGVTLSVPAATGGTAIVGWVASFEAASGKARSALSFGQDGVHVINHLLGDAAGNLLVAGSNRGALALSPSVTLPATAVASAFVAKLNGQLEPQWVTGWTGKGLSATKQMAVESAGTLVIVGDYGDSLSLGSGKTFMGQGSSGFVARLDASSGKVLSARGYGALGKTQSSTGLRIVGAGTAAGSIWYAGKFSGSLQLGPPAETLSFGASPFASIGFIGKLAP